MPIHRAGGPRRSDSRPKVCSFCAEHIDYIDYKEVTAAAVPVRVGQDPAPASHWHVHEAPAAIDDSVETSPRDRAPALPGRDGAMSRLAGDRSAFAHGRWFPCCRGPSWPSSPPSHTGTHFWWEDPARRRPISRCSSNASDMMPSGESLQNASKVGRSPAVQAKTPFPA